MSYDYWADVEGKPATLGALTSRLESTGYLRIISEDGRKKFIYPSLGEIIVRGRSPEASAYILTILAEGLFRRTEKRNYDALEDIANKVGIKLTEVKK